MSNQDKLIWDNREEEFSKLPGLDRHLATAAASSLAARYGRSVIIDRGGGERKVINAELLLALGLGLAAELRKNVQGSRVGIVLPTSAGAIIANLACILAGKSPVNLNFTLGTEALRSCLKRADLSTVITAEAVIKRATHFPWPEDTRDIAKLIAELSKAKTFFHMQCIRFLPFKLLSKLNRIPMVGGKQEAALIFTSGSSGEPKAVILTHRNLIGNIEQIADSGVLIPEDVIMSVLPLFHSIGFTVTMLFPLIKTAKVVTLPTPLEVTRIITAIREEKATIHVGTPTFLRPFFKKAKREDLQTLRGVVAGAEKTPEGMHDKWEEAFGSAYLEGYGLTETSPVAACNLPLKELRRAGSVGKLFPGMSARILNLDTGEPQHIETPGLLAMRGVNVFPGYLDNPEANSEAFDKDGWFISGDIARFDSDGFIYIEGRMSRFSKIGGEMVPHITVENAIARVLDFESSEKPVIAVSGRKDEAKGEVLVIVSTVDIDITQLRQKLKDAGGTLPNLWIPRDLVITDEIPILGSGKLDLKRLQEIAAKS